MAEKSTFENELPKKSTVKWLRGLDENGNPVLIDISDHATVVGELLKALTVKGDTSNIDLNNLTEWGLYPSGSLTSLSNLPSFTRDHNRGIIIVAGYSTRVQQTIITTYAEVAARFSIDGKSWEEWIVNS